MLLSLTRSEDKGTVGLDAKYPAGRPACGTWLPQKCGTLRDTIRCTDPTAGTLNCRIEYVVRAAVNALSGTTAV
jgi:hypothetical protein